MKTYHKINSVFKRDDNGKFTDEFATPEFETLRGAAWVWREKIDGMNIRISLNENGELDVRGRTDRAVIPPCITENLGFTAEDFVKTFGQDGEETLRTGHVVVYAEGVGPKIQKWKGEHVGIIMFDVRIEHTWLKHESVDGIAGQLGIPVSPVLGHYSLDDAVSVIRFASKGDGEYPSEFGGFESEGVVGTPAHGMLDRMGRRIITKLKLKDFR